MPCAKIRNWGPRHREAAALRWLCETGLLVLTRPGPPGRESEGWYAIITPAGTEAADGVIALG